MSTKLKIILLIIMGVVSYLVWGIGSYCLDKAMFTEFMGLNKLVASGLFLLMLHYAKSSLGGDPSPPSSQPDTTEVTQ